MAPSAKIDVDDFQREFFSQVGDFSQLLNLIEALHGIHYFIKDRSCRHVAVSDTFAKRLGLASAEGMIGRTNYDFYPKLIADQFARDDEQILRTGQAKLHIIEMMPSACGGFDWITTNKIPLFDSTGAVIGIMGTLQSHGDQFTSWADGESIGKAAEYIQRNCHAPVDVIALTKIAGVSQRHLNRKFHEVFGMSAQDFWVSTRIHRACDRITNSSKNVAQIAAEFGFCDQSAFSRQFRKLIGMAPLEYRRKFTRRKSSMAE